MRVRRSTCEPLPQIRDVLAQLDVEADQQRFGERPAPETWSAQEYLRHCLDMVGEALVVIGEGRSEPRVDIRDLHEASERIDELLNGLKGSDLDREIELGNAFPATPRWMLLHLQHDLEHHRLDIRRGYAKLVLAATDGPTVHR